MFSHWSLSDTKSLQTFRTLLDILSDLNIAIFWVVSIRSLISKSFNLCITPLVNIPRAPITIDITVTFMFHSFFTSLARSRYWSFFLLSFNFTLWSTRRAKSTFRQVHSFLLTIINNWLLIIISINRNCYFKLGLK